MIISFVTIPLFLKFLLTNFPVLRTLSYYSGVNPKISCSSSSLSFWSGTFHNLTIFLIQSCYIKSSVLIVSLNSGDRRSFYSLINWSAIKFYLIESPKLSLKLIYNCESSTKLIPFSLSSIVILLTVYLWIIAFYVLTAFSF